VATPTFFLSAGSANIFGLACPRRYTLNDRCAIPEELNAASRSRGFLECIMPAQNVAQRRHHCGRRRRHQQRGDRTVIEAQARRDVERGAAVV